VLMSNRHQKLFQLLAAGYGLQHRLQALSSEVAALSTEDFTLASWPRNREIPFWNAALFFPSATAMSGDCTASINPSARDERQPELRRGCRPVRFAPRLPTLVFRLSSMGHNWPSTMLAALVTASARTVTDTNPLRRTIRIENNPASMKIALQKRLRGVCSYVRFQTTLRDFGEKNGT